ncbi:MAG: TolC family protein [Ignavibacteria bacterium]
MNKLIAALIFFAAITASYGQSVRVLSLYDAINLAKRNNSDYVIAQLDKLKADKQVSEVYSENLVPTLTLSSRYTRSFRKQTITFSGQTFEIGSDNSVTTTLDVSEPIPFLGTPVFTGIRIAEYYSRIQDENVKSVESKIKTDVKKSFFNVLLLKEVIKLNQQSIDNAQENLRVVEARYKAGVALEYDYIRAKVKVETLKPQLSQSENNLAIAKKFLKNNIGLKDETEIDVSGSLIYDSTEVWGSMSDLIKKISNNNVAIRQLKLSKKINEQLVDVDYANYLPKFYVFGQWQSQANENDERSITGYRFFNSIVAGIGLSWNLNLWKNGYKEDQSKVEVRKSEEQIIKTKELLKTQTESVFLKIEDARNRIRSQEELVNTAQRGYDLANISYKSGVLNQIDVVDAELALSQVKLAYIQAIYDYLNARSELEQLLEK